MSQEQLKNKSIYTNYDFQQEGFIVHMLTSPAESFLTNAYLIETNNGVVAVDTCMLVSDAMVLRKHLIALGKPLIAIIITHGHPDHYNGNSVMLSDYKDVPVISTQGITECIRDSVDAKEKKWKPFFGDDWPNEIVLPNQWVSEGSLLTLDGLDYYFSDLGAAESNSDLYFTLGKNRSVVFVGDVVFNQMHGFMNDGHSARWIKVLKQLATELDNVERLFTGHGQPGNPSVLIAEQIDYITNYRAEVAILANGAKELSSEQKSLLQNILTKKYPHYQLTGFIQAGANSVAVEMAKENIVQYT